MNYSLQRKGEQQKYSKKNGLKNSKSDGIYKPVYGGSLIQNITIIKKTTQRYILSKLLITNDKMKILKAARVTKDTRCMEKKITTKVS